MAYPIYAKRKITNLSGIWDFQFLNGDAAPCLKDFDCSSLKFNTKSVVPGCFDAGIDFAGKRGIGVYRTTVNVEKAGQLRLHLPGVSLSAKIFFDGKAVGLYDLPYSGMDFYFQAEYAGLHELIIAVDNR